MIECPKCHFKGEEKGPPGFMGVFGVAIRQGNGIIDIGYRCLECDAEFGFEYFTEGE